MDVFSDMQIADQVRASLAQDSLMRRSDIGISVTAGIVYLSGRVSSYFDNLRAQEIASQVNGVRGIQNILIVKSLIAGKSDREISDAIQRDLWRTPFVYVESAAISVEDGVVKLSGVVESLEQFECARQKAYDAGAKRVENYLEVKNGPATITVKAV